MIEETDASTSSSPRKGRSLSIAICLFLLAYFVTRLISLNALPIFLDEAVHIQWAERLVNEGRVLRPIGAGRVLAVALYALALPFEDRLWAARAVASLAGALTLVFTMLLSHRLFGRRAALIAGGLYLLSPFALVYDRLALSDGFLAAFITGSMFFTLILIRDPAGRARLWFQAGAAAFVALAVFSKVSALLFLGLIPLGVVILSPAPAQSLRRVLPSTIAGLALAAPMLWFFFANSGEIREQHVVDPMTSGPIILSTLTDMTRWVLAYFTVPTLVVAALALGVLKDRRALWLAMCVGMPFLLFALFSQPWSARYVLPTLAPFLVLTAGGIDVVTTRMSKSGSGWMSIVAMLMASIRAIPFSLTLLRTPEAAPFPPDDRLQLVTGWPSGYGVRELAGRLREEGDSGPIEVYVDAGGIRTVSADLAILLSGHPAIELTEGDFASPQFPAMMTAGLEARRAFVVVTPRTNDLGLKSLVSKARMNRLVIYQRPGGEWAATLFELTAAPEVRN